MSQAARQRPPIGGFHHFGVTVTDVEASADWYQRVLGLERIPAKIPHHGNEESGYAVLLADFSCGIIVGLQHNTRNDGQPFDEAGLERTLALYAGAYQKTAAADLGKAVFEAVERHRRDQRLQDDLTVLVLSRPS